MEYLSKERYDQIVAELNHLIDVEYPRIKDDLSDARAQGDLSENAEYRSARRAQAKAISRIRFLQESPAIFKDHRHFGIAERSDFIAQQGGVHEYGLQCQNDIYHCEPARDEP